MVPLICPSSMTSKRGSSYSGYTHKVTFLNPVVKEAGADSAKEVRGDPEATVNRVEAIGFRVGEGVDETVAVTVTVIGDDAGGPEHPAKGISRAMNNKSETIILIVYKILVTVFVSVNHPIVITQSSCQ